MGCQRAEGGMLEAGVGIDIVECVEMAGDREPPAAPQVDEIAAPHDVVADAQPLQLAGVCHEEGQRQQAADDPQIALGDGLEPHGACMREGG